MRQPGQAKDRIVVDQASDQQSAGLEPPGHRLQVETLQKLADRPGGNAAAGIHRYDRIGETRDLVDRVRHVDDRYLDLAAEALDEGHDLELARLVERGQRLVHEQNARAGEQCPADGDTLLLATGEPARPSLEQRLDAEQRDDMVDRAEALATRR